MVSWPAGDSAHTGKLHCCCFE